MPAAVGLLFAGAPEPAVLNYVQQRLRAAGVRVATVETPGATSMLRLSVTFSRLQVEAESEELLLRVKDGADGYEREVFTVADAASFVGDGELDEGEQALLLMRIVSQVEAGSGLDALLPHSKVRKGESLTHALLRAGAVETVSPLHAEGGALRKSIWKRGFAGSLASPVDAIKAYYGPEVALYFAWMNYFTLWLCAPGFVGVAMYLHRPEGRTIDNSPWIPFFSLFVVVWGMLFLRFWKRRMAAEACRWGTLDVDEREHVRPEFWGDMVVSKVTGQPERYFSYVRRMPRYLLSVVVTAVMLSVAFSVMVCSLNLQGYIHEGVLFDDWLHVPALEAHSRAGALFDPNGNVVMSLVPTVAHSVTILLLNTIYRSIAMWLTDLENHRTEHQAERSLIIKRFLFEAFDCYVALFYLAFVQLDVKRLRQELVALYTTDSVRRVFTETLLPLAMQWGSRKQQRRSLAAEKKATGEKPAGVAPELEEMQLDEYEAFDDYLEMIIEFGYVTLFASAFPLAAAISVLCNLLEVRSDLFKISHLCRRPVARQACNLGPWDLVLTCMVFASVLTNVLLFSFSSEQMLQWLPSLFEHEDGEQVLAAGLGRYVVGLAFGIEHILLLLGAVIWFAVPGRPEWVDTEAKRVQFATAAVAKEARRERLVAFHASQQ